MFGCLAVLADKDAEGSLAPSHPASTGAVCTEPPTPVRPMGRPGAKACRFRRRAGRALAGAAGVAARGGRPTPRRRRIDADRSELARSEAGSHSSPARITFCRYLWNGRARSELLSMMGLVAAVVAVVILVFFGLGYLFGRLFL